MFLGIGVRVADGGNVLAGDAMLGQPGDDVGIDRVAPGRRVDPQIGEDECQMAVTFATRALIFESGKSAAVEERSRASSASLRPSVVMARALSSQGFTCPARIAS